VRLSNEFHKLNEDKVELDKATRSNSYQFIIIRHLVMTLSINTGMNFPYGHGIKIGKELKTFT
jgi:hypothetical protein